MKRDIPALTGLRGVAALWVFFYHALALTKGLDTDARWPMLWLGSGGYLGVDIFFVLSGFVIAHHYAGDDLHRHARSYAIFLGKRLARIYPTYVAALLFFSACLFFAKPDPPVDLSVTTLFESLLLVQSWTLQPKIVWNPVAWSLSCEWAAYLVFPWLALSTRSLKIGPALCWILVLYLALRFSVIHIGTTDGVLPRVAVGFCAGLLIHRIWCEASARQINLGAIIALAGIVLVSAYVDIAFGPRAAMKNAAILSCFIVYGVASSTGLLERAMTRLEYFGCLSYSFYLVHFAILQIAREVLERWLRPDAPWAVYCVITGALVISICVSALMYSYIEQPARNFLLGHKSETTRLALSPMAVASPSPRPPELL